jgi:hypothetical protein
MRHPKNDSKNFGQTTEQLLTTTTLVLPDLFFFFLVKKLFFIACVWKTKVFHVILRLLNNKIGINNGTLP